MSTGGMHSDSGIDVTKTEIIWFLYAIFNLILGVLYFTVIIKTDIEILMIEDWFLLKNLHLLVTNESYWNDITTELIHLHANIVSFIMLGYLSFSKHFSLKHERKYKERYGEELKNV